MKPNLFFKLWEVGDCSCHLSSAWPYPVNDAEPPKTEGRGGVLPAKHAFLRQLALGVC
jgi:hypothetical protein